MSNHATFFFLRFCPTSFLNRCTWPIFQDEVRSLAQYLTEEEVYWPSGNAFHCPPPPRPLRADLCEASRCDQDADCHGKKQACCYNGCVFTCMRKLEPPPGMLLELCAVETYMIVFFSFFFSYCGMCADTICFQGVYCMYKRNKRR